MWLIFGVGAIILALANLTIHFQNKDASLYRFLSMALTALTLCHFYSDGAKRAATQDWAGLMDIMPTVSTGLWICTIGSIALNSVSLWKKPNK